MAIALEQKHAVAVLEAAHAGHAGLQQWLDNLVATMRRLVPAADLVVAAIVQRFADHWELVAGDTAAHALGPLAEFGRMLPHVDPAALDGYYRIPEHVGTHSEIRTRIPAAKMVGDQFVQNLGVEDSVALISQAGCGISMVVFSMTSHLIALTPQDKSLLVRAAAHVEAALRIRVGDGPPVAIVDANGRIRDADGDGRDPALRDRLSHHVRGIERKRLRNRRQRADAIDGWTALVSGRYGLVEHIDGGRREYHVLPNPAHVWSARALTNSEARVLELFARGMTGKLVAYSLGLSFATVSRAIGSAARKVGCGSRTEIVRLAASVLQPDGLTAVPADLTVAEREILELLRDGWSNAAIASARGSSERTVANQVGSLLRKSGQASRKQLATLRDDDETPASRAVAPPRRR